MPTSSWMGSDAWCLLANVYSASWIRNVGCCISLQGEMAAMFLRHEGFLGAGECRESRLRVQRPAQENGEDHPPAS